ncbi:MAG: GTP cyclohydrolase I FolE [Saprospiraceae bacterium]
MFKDDFHSASYTNGNSHATSVNGRQNGAAITTKPRHKDIRTPLVPDAFDRSDDEKMAIIAHHFHAIMETLGLDMEDDSLQDTPKRVAKMFVKEIFYGLDPANMPKISLFENRYGYGQMLVERDIKLHSFCEHHFLPIYGKAHVAYIAGDQVIGLSKLNRIVDYYARRPQVQERLTIQIAEALKKSLKTEHVAVFIEASHMCVQARGVKHEESLTTTAEYSGRFLEDVQLRNEFLQTIRSGK